MDCAQVGVLEKTNEVGLGGFLQGKNGRSLETEVGLEVLGDLTDETLEWELADEELGGLLVATDFAKGDRAWSVTVWLLDTTGGWGGFACCLGGELLAWGFASGGFTCGLFCASHD